MPFMMPFPIDVPMHQEQGVEVAPSRNWELRNATPDRLILVAKTSNPNDLGAKGKAAKGEEKSKTHPLKSAGASGLTEVLADAGLGRLPRTPLSAISGERPQPKWAHKHKPVLVVHFAFNSSVLSKQARDQITNLPVGCYHIVGSADPVGTEHYNRWLSTRRAKHVAKMLINQSSRADWVGIGEIDGIPHSDDRRAEVYSCAD